MYPSGLTINLGFGWSRVNIEGYQEVIISKKKNLFLPLKIVFVLANSVDPDEMPRTSKRKNKIPKLPKKTTTLFIFVGTP